MTHLISTKSALGLFYLCFSLLLFSCTGEEKSETNNSVTFSQDWQVFSSQDLKATGAEISSSQFEPSQAYITEMPATVMATLNRHGVFGDVFMGDNISKIDEAQFDQPWWYRKVFDLDSTDLDLNHRLVFEGLNYKANIWLNGQMLASSDSIEGCFRMYDFNISDVVQSGSNTLAVEIIPPQWGDLTIGFVDWNPWPPDDNMGIWRPVKLISTGPLRLRQVFVKPDLQLPSLDKASLEMHCYIDNLSNELQTGEINIEFDGRTISKQLELNPGESKILKLTESEHKELSIENPRIWWPNNMGSPELYPLKASVRSNNTISDSYSSRFGIRKVEDYFNEQGHRGYKINGKELLITGGGWVDDIFLDDSDEKIKDQIRYVKHMNLNTIRLEGFWGKNKKIYDYADEMGILIMIGWSCQWEWTDYCGREEDEYLAIKSEKEIREHTTAYKNQVEWLRNHPSVFLWVYGSDKLLIPELEESMNAMIAQEDGTRPILNSCGGRVSTVTGKSGVKMNGPYSYVTPNYWYLDDSRGGAFGFNTETGPGLQMAPIESIRKMIPEEHMWPVDSIWEFHLGRREFASFENWIGPFTSRYGMEENVEKFTHKSQMATYEAMRAMFESFHINRPNTTGIIQWMLNSAWPAMMWQLYDYYLMPNAAFYATRKACQPINIAYNYKDQGVYICSQTKSIDETVIAEIRTFDVDGTTLSEESNQ